MVVNEKHDWGEQLPFVESAYNVSVSAATVLVPNELHMAHFPRLLRTAFDLPHLGGHRGPNWDQLWGTATDRH